VDRLTQSLSSWRILCILLPMRLAHPSGTPPLDTHLPYYLFYQNPLIAQHNMSYMSNNVRHKPSLASAPPRGTLSMCLASSLDSCASIRVHHRCAFTLPSRGGCPGLPHWVSDVSGAEPTTAWCGPKDDSPPHSSHLPPVVDLSEEELFLTAFSCCRSGKNRQSQRCGRRTSPRVRCQKVPRFTVGWRPILSTWRAATKIPTRLVLSQVERWARSEIPMCANRLQGLSRSRLFRATERGMLAHRLRRSSRRRNP